MKKRLLALCLAIFALNYFSKAQTITVVTDTLHYYFNKHYFKNGGTANNFPFYKSAAATSTALTHVGSKFEYKTSSVDSPLVVTGLEAFACMGGSTSQQTIKVHLYLCNLNSAGMPVLPALDSVITTVTGSSTKYTNIGGNLIHGEKRITKDYAVLFRNMSTVKGDTVKLMRTAGKTLTATAYPSSLAPWQHKYSDGFGFARNKGTFVSTTNLDLPVYDFVYGSDYEFCVAPRVRYYLVADEILPNEIVTSQTVTTFTPLLFKNTSSFHFTHRQYNLLEFYRKWSNLSVFIGQPVNGGWSADSSITWYFNDYDRGPGMPDPRKFLPYGGGNNQIIHLPDSGDIDCFKCQFRANLRTMQIYGRGDQVKNKQDFDLCVEYGPGDAVSISKNGLLNHLSVYPNPLVNGKVNVAGLTGKNTIHVYNVLGQIVSTDLTEAEKIQIDLSKEAKGTYFVKIMSANAETKVMKIQKLD